MPVLSRDAKVPVTFLLNGEETTGYAEPRMLLTDFLRQEIGATGTHVGCEHGVCGACTVLVDGRAVRSCLMLAVQAEGAEITTIEGLAAPDGALSPLQQAFHEHFALQCGFCTPGFLITLTELERRGTRLNESDLREALSGNLCRCTGYAEIIDAALSVLGTAAAPDAATNRAKQ